MILSFEIPSPKPQVSEGLKAIWLMAILIAIMVLALYFAILFQEPSPVYEEEEDPANTVEPVAPD